MVRRLAIFAIHVPRLHLLPFGRPGAARLYRAPLVCRHRPIDAGVFRRTGLAAQQRKAPSRPAWQPAFWCQAYTLLLPSISDTGIIGEHIVGVGPLGIAWLQPQAHSGSNCRLLVLGVVLSLFANITLFVGCSLLGRPSAIERMQADLFVPSSLAPMAPSFRLRRASVTVEELIATVTRYLGEERTRESFASFAAALRLSLEPQAEADFQLLQYGEYLLASAIGAASSRLVLSLLLRKRNVSTKAALKLLDDANAAIHYNREILQTALDHVRQGIAVFDKELALVCWNRQFGELFDLPHGLTRVGTPLDEILRHIAQNGGRDGRGVTADGKDFDAQIAERVRKYRSEAEPFLERFADRGLVIEVRADRMPGGGLVTTFTDITPSVKSAEALERANATLERRVRERTRELTRLNSELERAKAEADDANVSKTRFIAAASHDILQPLDAARLYVTSLIERQRAGGDSGLVHNIDASLEAVEEIFAALLEISRLDTGAMQPKIERIPHRRVAAHFLDVEFAPLARAKRLTLKFIPCSLAVRSDRRLLRRLTANLVSNAIKLCAARHRAGRLPPAGIAAAHRRLRYRHRHPARQAARRVQGVSPARSRRARCPRRRARATASIVEGASRACWKRKSRPRSIRLRPGSRFPSRCGRRAARGGRRGPRAIPPAGIIDTVDMHRQRARDPRRHADAAGRLGCRVGAKSRATSRRRPPGRRRPGPVSYHLDGANGVSAVLPHFTANTPAISSPRRSSMSLARSAASSVHIINKAGQAGLAACSWSRWRVQRGSRPSRLSTGSPPGAAVADSILKEHPDGAPQGRPRNPRVAAAPIFC